MPRKADTWMPLYVADYLRDTMRLTTVEHGAYMLLLMASWTEDGRLPDDDTELAAIVKLGVPEWIAIAPKLRRFFAADGDFLIHKRVVEEREKAEHITVERSSAGKEGARRRWQKEGKVAGKHMANAMANASQTGSQNDAPSPSPSSDEERDADASLSPEGDGEREASRDEVREAFDTWNRMATLCAMPLAQALTDGRRKAIKARLTAAGLDGWRRAVMAVAISPHCRGKNDRKWKADIDFVAQAKNFPRLLEGFYGTGETVPKPKSDAPAKPPDWPGPPEVRLAVVAKGGEGFARSWLDICTWREEPTKAVVTKRSIVAERLRGSCTRILDKMGVEIVLEPAQ